MLDSFPNYHKARVAVIGDIMVDRYFYGDVQRISPEAPVPVVNVQRESLLPGGAANVAMNLSALGAHIKLSGVVGRDADAEQLLTQIESVGVECCFNYSHNDTIVKARVMGEQQQLLRMDFEKKFTIEDWEGTWAACQSQLNDVDVLVLSDYNKGTLHDCQALIKAAKKQSIPVLIDPKGSDFRKYSGADLLTPNLSELIAIVGVIHSEAELQEKAQQLIQELNIGALLVTRSEKGMTLFRRALNEYHLPAITKEVVDVTGAGDTVIATIAASLAAGSDIESAVMFSNIAASIVVSKVGTTAVTAPELEFEYHKHHYSHGLLNNEQLALAVNLARERGEKVVFTNGCFDILHAGHVAYLDQARKLGDRLIVAINSDESVTKLKGPGRPINSVDRRMAVLQGLASVDWVTCFTGDTPEALLEALQPDILVKGGDYTKEQVVGREIVQAYGGSIKVMAMVPECSTTKVIEKARS
ncbi:bifunctional heptose 7-phosphate kinase/heptose 1-phosphate adenyltransferase [Candidatus Endobugula sertula]|uniref:Bifunctional protein HldE n=1 Tax=Candidatus Endobugula sertula TaxID=62101 RepID=A0A1D2QSJ5_9GAMM|nr:bifunctional heptose 7-phosphate kinase/heptose 1-phosphate adenyltransferase [Candidatus Endobugula sertula]